jgi:hypothetical protein
MLTVTFFLVKNIITKLRKATQKKYKTKRAGLKS